MKTFNITSDQQATYDVFPVKVGEKMTIYKSKLF